MLRLTRVMWIAALALVELGILYADGLLLIGLLIASNAEASLPAKLSLGIICVCDPVSFIVSWFRPKVAAIILAVSAGVAALLAIFAADLHSLKALWFLGAIFWAGKFILCSFFFYKMGPIIRSSNSAVASSI
jgi:hypothetical protein